MTLAITTPMVQSHAALADLSSGQRDERHLIKLEKGGVSARSDFTELRKRTGVHPLDAKTLRQRLSKLRQRVPEQTKIMVVVKNVFNAPAWAHAIEKADTDSVVHAFGFECAGDALAYRKLSSAKEAMVLYPVALKYVTELAFADVSVVAPGTWWVQQALAKLKAHGKVPKLGVHLFVDTGMGRDGVMPDSAPELASIIQKSAAHLHMRGVMSHLCCTSYITSAKRHGNSSPENIKDMFGGEGKVKAWNKPDMTSLQLRQPQNETQAFPDRSRFAGDFRV